MNKAFSLLELAIVLAIIGLIAGGVVVGSSMIHAAELRSAITEQEQYKKAVSAFKEKYNEFPGDMTNATRIWGAQQAPHANCIALDETTPSTDSRTCNGNGDGIVGNSGSDEWERFRFWQHLANAQLILGEYSGVHGAGDIELALPGGNTPQSQFDSLGWSIEGLDIVSATDTTKFAGTYGTPFILGAQTANDSTYGPSISPIDAFNIDSKIDDGKPGTGNVVTRYYDSCANASTSTDLDAEYILSTEDKLCALYFKNIMQ